MPKPLPFVSRLARKSKQQQTNMKGVLLLVLLMCVSACYATLSATDIQTIVSRHNYYRADARLDVAAIPALPKLVWDTTVAASAQAWANNCQFQHSGGQYGENIWAGSTGFFTVTNMVDSWASEKASFTYPTTCNAPPGKSCGHYTQIIWKDTRRIGCGLANACPSGFDLLVCQYDPPGNFVGAAPYPAAKPCSSIKKKFNCRKTKPFCKWTTAGTCVAA